MATHTKPDSTRIVEVEPVETHDAGHSLNHYIDCHHPDYPDVAACGVDISGHDWSEGYIVDCVVCLEFEYCNCDCPRCLIAHPD